MNETGTTVSVILGTAYASTYCQIRRAGVPECVAVLIALKVSCIMMRLIYQELR